MLATSVTRTGLRSAPPAVRAFSGIITPWGSDKWRHEKNSFIKWTTLAAKPETSVAKREFYGFIATAFGDVDLDKDGKIDAEQFDRLLEKVAAVPRRFGLAPQSTDDYATRLAKHTELFNKLDAAEGSKRGFLALDQFVDYAYKHIAEKVGQIPEKDVGLDNYEDYTLNEYVDFIDRAVANPGSYERSTFYNFILTCFCEADAESRGRVTFQQFDALLDRAARVPRHFGLAPQESDPAKRKAMFDKMELKRDGKGTGFVTMRVFWEWTLEHTAQVIGDFKAGKGYKK